MSDLEALGYAAEDRAVVVHVDDLGMCTAANAGGIEALEGLATCGSIMVPCPGFEEMSKLAGERPELDIGVHLTLNAEYPTFRWGPVREDVPGLVSPDGGMWRTTDETVEHAAADEVDRELRAQIDRALDAGIDVTHIDSHMGTVFNPKFVEVYLKLAVDYALPAFIPRVTREALAALSQPENLERYTALMRRYHRTQMRRTRILGRALRNPWINRLDALLPSKLVSTLFSPLVIRVHASDPAGRRAPGRPRYPRTGTAD